MPAQVGIQRVNHLADAQILGAGDRLAEVVPELAQHRLPVDAPAGDVVELFL